MKKISSFIFVAILLIIITLPFSIAGYYFLSSTKSVFAYDADIAEIQTRLSNWGYYSGDINGEMTSDTISAIEYFQSSNGLTVTGEIDGATASALGVSMSGQSSGNLYLLAKCIYAEARGEIYVGKVAVGAVILNRVADANFPNTIYGVIYQPWAFTAVHDGQINLEPDTNAYEAAQDALNGWDPTYGSLYYYNPEVATSSWIFSREVVVEIGKHVFAR